LGYSPWPGWFSIRTNPLALTIALETGNSRRGRGRLAFKGEKLIYADDSAGEGLIPVKRVRRPDGGVNVLGHRLRTLKVAVDSECLRPGDLNIAAPVGQECDLPVFRVPLSKGSDLKLHPLPHQEL
jgi:hypothetical protein